MNGDVWAERLSRANINLAVGLALLSVSGMYNSCGMGSLNPGTGVLELRLIFGPPVLGALCCGVAFAARRATVRTRRAVLLVLLAIGFAALTVVVLGWCVVYASLVPGHA